MNKIFYTCIAALLALSSPINQLSAQRQPKKGEVIITEFMVNPEAVSDTKGEWIELFNCTQDALILNELVLFDLGSNKHTLAAEENLILNPGAYFLLARNANYEENGGLNPDYVYSNFSMGNSEDEIILANALGEVIDGVSYQSDWPLVAGASLELDPASADSAANNLPTNWNESSSVYGAGDFGTPGSPNAALGWNPAIKDDPIFEAWPIPASEHLFVRYQVTTGEKVTLDLIDLLGRKIRVYSHPANSTMQVQLDLSFQPRGLYYLQLSSGNNRDLVPIILD